MIIPVVLSRNELVNHEQIIGRTNAGKSVAMLVQYQGIVKLPNLSTMLFAVESSQLRKIPKNSIILNCSEQGNYRYNPLAIVPGTTLNEHVDDLCRSFSTLWLGIASMGMMKPIITQLVKDGRTMKDLVRTIQNTPKSELRDKILNRLAIIDNPFFDTKKAINLEVLSNMHVIFLIEGLDSQVASFFFNDIVSKIMRHKRNMYEHSKNVENQHLEILLLDEAQRFLPGADLKRDDIAYLPLISAIAQSRKLGIGFIFAFQQPSMINDAFLANAGTILAGPLGNEEDIHSIRNTLGLNRDQLDYYRLMPQRKFLFKKSGSTVFPIEIPEVYLPETIVDKEFIDSWNKNAGEVARELFHKETPVNTKPIAEKNDHYLFIETINSNPFHSVTYYYELLKEHFALQKANRIRNELEGKGFIRSHKIPTGKRYVVGIEATDEGLNHFGIERNFTLSRGADFPHSYIVENVKRHFEKQGKAVSKEHRFANHFCDLYIEPGLIIEIAIANKSEREKENILADLEHVSKVLVIGNNKAHLETIRAILPTNANVHYKLFCEFNNGTSNS